ncbi:MAG TPA: dihydrofolate reductase, partial [Cyanobacteria bacterium UBA11166]|nr:dihydrofolate reductase [Cyanobacteria bacterium UBA11166]
GKLSYILTSRDLSTPRNDIFFVKGDIPEVIENINKKNYQRVWVVGGGKVASSFISQGLIDEY